MALDADPIREGQGRRILTEPLPLYILAGGQSRRFGSDKARAVLSGVPLVVRAARALEAASAITVVARQPGQYADLGLETIADLRPGLGPMGGLETALDHVRSGPLLLVACDMSHFEWQWAQELQTARGDATAAAHRSAARWEPLFAVYDCGIRGSVTQALDTGNLSLQALLDGVNAVAVDLPPDWPTPAQINTPEDLAIVEGRHPSGDGG